MHTTTATRILCFWDSLTRGRIPAGKRFTNNERRTWVMQASLWSSFEVIEEWMRWRYTNYENKKSRGRNGLTYFYPCLLSQFPIDILIIFLWTNNMQTECNHSAEQITASFGLYKAELEVACKEFEMSLPKVILVSPPYIDSTLLRANSIFNPESEDTSKILNEHYEAFAKENNRHFFDAAEIVWYWVIDWVHLDKEQNKELGKAMAEFIKDL